LSDLRILVLGPPVITLNGAPIDVDTRKATALIVYLAVKNIAVRRDTLITLFWTDYDDSSARATFRRTLSVAHRALEKQWLDIDGEQISLKQGTGLFVDAVHFRTLIANARTHHASSDVICATCAQWLAEAIELYRDVFLAGFTLKDGVEFDNWQESEAQRLSEDLNTAFERLTRWHMQNQDYAAAVAYLQRWLQVDPLQEPAHHRLIEAYALSGQRTAALQQYKEFEALLQRELGVVPLQKTAELYEAVLRDDLRPSTLGKHRSMPEPTDHLPIYTKPFVGRQVELQTLAQWLATPSGRLFTIIGPGGIGKTRLAVQAARTRLDQFPDGIYLCALQPPSGDNSIISQIASAIGFSFYQGPSPKKQLLDYLQNKHMLVILDNFETCLDDVLLVPEILGCAPGVKLLVTSHKQLNLHEAWVIQLQGLTFPAQDDPHTDDFDSIQMFVEYARLVSAAFSAKGQEKAIARICRLVEGNPLALELAARWTEMLPCHEIAEEISTNFDLLQASADNVPERHASLWAVFEYSWNQLSNELRVALWRLCVFQNGFTRQAAHEIAEIELAMIAALVRCSMLWADGQGRFFVPRIVKHYAQKKALYQAGNPIPLAERHSRYYGQWLNNHLNELHAVQAEFENILAGWHWAVQAHSAELLDLYCDPLRVCYDTLGRLSEGREIFAQAVQVMAEYTTTSKYRLLLGKLKSRLGHFEMHLGAFDEAYRLLYECLDLFEGSTDFSEQAFVFNTLGLVHLVRGRYTEADRQFEQSQEIYEELRDEVAVGRVLNNRGLLAIHQSDHAKAAGYLQQALRIFRASGNRRLIASALNNLGNAAVGAEDLTNAASYFSESYQIKHELGDTWGAACSLTNVGHIALSQNEPVKAQEAFAESLELSTTVGQQRGVVNALNGLALAASKEGNFPAASRHFGEALHLALNSGANVTALEILKDIADMLIRRGYQAEAAQILNTVLHDHRTHAHTRQQVEALLSQVTEAGHSQRVETFEEVRERILKGSYLPLSPLLKDVSGPTLA